MTAKGIRLNLPVDATEAEVLAYLRSNGRTAPVVPKMAPSTPPMITHRTAARIARQSSRKRVPHYSPLVRILWFLFIGWWLALGVILLLLLCRLCTYLQPGLLRAYYRLEQIATLS